MGTVKYILGNQIFHAPDRVTLTDLCRYGCIVNESSNIESHVNNYVRLMQDSFLWSKQLAATIVALPPSAGQPLGLSTLTMCEREQD